MTTTQTTNNSQDKAKHGGLPGLPNARAQYDAQAIETILSLRTCRHDFSLWWAAVCRLVTIVTFFVRIIWMSWWDRQIWSYIGEEDIDHAQSLRRHRHGKLITAKLLQLGPTFIKVGQSLSTRVDLIRKEYIEELSQLQDRVPMFSQAQVEATIETELGASPYKLFDRFDPEPIAAASLGQVHRVLLPTGQEAVIKVQRPNLVRTFQIDLSIMKHLAKALQRSTELGRSREWADIVDEFGRTLFEEIDYIREGRNADRFRRNFAQLPDVVIPKIHWKYTARRVITMEYLPGTKISDLTALDAAGFSRPHLSTVLVQAYFQQLLLDGFFHADPHPGNIVVDANGRIVLYDFGMVGSIRDESRVKMVNTFLNIVAKRTDAILQNLTDLGMIAPGADLDEIRTIVDWALENYYDVPHDQLNFEQLAEEMAEVMYYYPFKLPASFTFMFRALITLEGVSTTLYPQIQFMGIAVAYAKDFIARQDFVERLFTADSAENYRQIIKEGLELLGFPTPRDRNYTSSRVRLYHEEWKPLARYVKAGFLMMAAGQTVMIVMLMSVMLLFVQRYSPQEVPLAASGMIIFLMFYLLLTFGTLLWLPARKKPVLFQPPKRQP